MKKTITFDRLMACVRYVDTPMGGRYLMTFDGMRRIFKDTAEVVPYVKEQGYTVIDGGKEM